MSDTIVTGVTSQAPEWFFEEMFNTGIDLSFKEFLKELEDQGIEEDSESWQLNVDCYQNDNSYYLVGAWFLNEETGKYEIDRTGKRGDYAATYSNRNGDIVCVEWSVYSKLTHHTSPCYVMSDGSGPCGDLDTEGDSVTAYTLPQSDED